jgi:hypothetical protein
MAQANLTAAVVHILKLKINNVFTLASLSTYSHISTRSNVQEGTSLTATNP